MTKLDRVQIDYELTFGTPFHCGTGVRVGLVDRTVVRDHNGYLYVPGSTFKGVLREHCEQLARFYEPDEQKRQLITSPHDEDTALIGLGQKITMITRIFGSQIHPGHLFFEDVRQLPSTLLQYNSQEEGEEGNGKYKSLQVNLYTQVRLDRPTRTAVRGALYTSEFGVRDFTFRGSITGGLECTAIEDPRFITEHAPDDSPTYSLLLLLAGLCVIQRLGGNKSTGKGQCTCQITNVLLNRRECPHWKSWLEHLNILTLYPM